MKNYYLRMAIMSIAMMTINMLIDSFLLKDVSLIFNYPVIVIFFLITGFTHRWLLNIIKTNERSFPNAYMLSRITKIFVYFVLAIAYAWFDREHAKEFLISYVIIYIVFMIYESSKLTKIARANPAKENLKGSDDESSK